MFLSFNTEATFYVLNTPRKKTSLGESLAGSHAYNPIRDSRRDCGRNFSRQKLLYFRTVLDRPTDRQKCRNVFFFNF